MTRLSQARRHYAGIAEKVSGGTGSGAGDLAGPGASGTSQTGRRLYGLLQVFALPAHRGPVPGGLRLEWYPSPSADGLDRDLHRSDPRERCEQEPPGKVSDDEIVSDDPRGIGPRREQARGGS